MPFEDEADAALQALRQRVFDEGAFHLDPDVEIAELSGMEAQDPDGFARMASGERPRSIEEALNWAIPNGTHSILDVDYVSTPGDDGGMRALRSDELQAIFGTDQPQATDLARHQHDILGCVDARGGGVYLVGYEGDRPISYAFVGYSGD